MRRFRHGSVTRVAAVTPSDPASARSEGAAPRDGGEPLRRCAISIDVDPIPCYYRIHALGAPPANLRDVVLQRAVPRFAEILGRRGIAATFFIVAEDVDVTRRGDDARAARALIREVENAGHEIGSHSYAHPYELARWPASMVDAEIGRAHDLLGDAVGYAVTGFRAPGYDLSPAMVDALIRRGYQYDSSIFPAPAYYAAKAAVMAALALRGRPSGAVLTDPRALVAPTDPYRPSPRSPWRRGRAPLIELPVAVTPWTRLPAIGTSLLLAPSWLRRRFIAQMTRRPFFNFELHGIDLIDTEADGVPGELVARQPDLRLPLARKRAALESMLDQLATSFTFAPLADAAAWAERTLAAR